MKPTSPQALRTERDSFGPIGVPAERLWGAQTQRSLQHFDISGERMAPELLRALAQVKRASAYVNQSLGLLDAAKATAIVAAADEVIAGQHAGEFPLVVWQTGSGTQTNMNMNEVLANRASQLLGGPRGEGRLVHPNDDVNKSQSSNDVFPTAMHVAAVEALVRRLLPGLQALRTTLGAKAEAFAGIVKIGRTHLQDATPITLGQEISGWVAQLHHAEQHVRAALPHLGELALGGTAVGTGINALPGFADGVAQHLRRLTGLPFREASNHFAAQAAMDAAVELSGQLKTVAVTLMKISNDLRWMNSGPIAGLGEIALPAMQPGSSIMPGKVNPVIPEAVAMVAAQVMGNDLTVTIAGQSGIFELNVMLPVLAHNLLQSITLLASGSRLLADKAIAGTVANRERMLGLIDKNPILVTALNPVIGYDKAAAAAKQAYAQGRTIREVVVELGYLSDDEAARLLDARPMTGA